MQATRSPKERFYLRLKKLVMMKTHTSLPTPAAPSDLASKFAEVFTNQVHQSGVGPSAEVCMRAAATACRELLAQRWAQTQLQDKALAGTGTVRRAHYLSMEFLMGRALGNALSALGLSGAVSAQLAQCDKTLGDVLEKESDQALGNGGLGRLAACFLDSFAELGLPSFGYGMRYEFGMFAQQIRDGRQYEVPDDWMRNGNPWEIHRPELRYSVGLGGYVHEVAGKRQWVPGEEVIATAYDFVVPAHHSERVSTLRQWHANAPQAIDFGAFCRGDYQGAAANGLKAEYLNWVLYPDDSTEAGRYLRLKQEAFLVSASLQDIIARHLREGKALADFGKANAIHLNDTHPALAPAELMRLLIDEQGLAWEAAWAITQETVSYTNHTLMPEALETWPVRMFEALLPRHLEIIFEINRRFLADVRQRFPGDEGMVERVSLVDERGERRLRMAALSIVASHKINGVSALHSDLMVQTIFADFAKLFPGRFHNVTNGVTPRRWLEQANPDLSTLIDSSIGKAWRTDLAGLSALRPLAGDAALGKAFQQAKHANKVRLAALIERQLGIKVNTDSLFDVQTKRIHEYKRQLLNVLHVIARYQAIVANPAASWVPRTVIIAGKAASAYQMAKSIIELIHGVANVINNDPRVGDKLKLVFIPNYSVSLAEIIMPAADLSEQISTAGTEASGTGNMKFALNGALTIGTWDGANIEMAQAMGVENMFVFGLRTEEVRALVQAGYNPRKFIDENSHLQQVIHAIGAGDFSEGDGARFHGITGNLLGHDSYLLMADFAAYVDAQRQVDGLFAQPAEWAKRAILNVAGMGAFSTDRTIREYIDRVWARQTS